MNNSDKSGRTPLLWAILYRNYITKILIESGANVNQTNTPLLIYAVDNNIEIITLLLSNTIDVNQSDSLGQNALHHSFTMDI